MATHLLPIQEEVAKLGADASPNMSFTSGMIGVETSSNLTAIDTGRVDMK